MHHPFALLLAFVLSNCGERYADPACIESVQVVAPGYDAKCPWGTQGQVTPTGEGNVAFHCVCPRDGGAR